jgi:hypothetical protein
MKAEISYDLAMEEKMSFVEGAYRLADAEWRVFIFIPDDVGKPTIKLGQWESGVRGIVVRVPRTMPLNCTVVEQVLSASLEVGEWTVVHGPDSMQLR